MWRGLFAGLLTALMLLAPTHCVAGGTEMHEMQNSHRASAEDSPSDQKWGRSMHQHYFHKTKTYGGPGDF
jgi:hypothetical protein